MHEHINVDGFKKSWMFFLISGCGWAVLNFFVQTEASTGIINTSFEVDMHTFITN